MLSDAKRLVPDGLASPALLAGIARAHNHANLAVAETDDGGRVLLTPAGELDPTHYVDSATSAAYAVDHVARSAAPAPDRSAAAPAACEAERAAVDAAFPRSAERTATCPRRRLRSQAAGLLSWDHLVETFSGDVFRLQSGSRDRLFVERVPVVVGAGAARTPRGNSATALPRHTRPPTARR